MGPRVEVIRAALHRPNPLPRAFHYPAIVGAQCRWSGRGQRWRWLGSSSVCVCVCVSVCVAFFFLPHLFHRTCVLRRSIRRRSMWCRCSWIWLLVLISTFLSRESSNPEVSPAWPSPQARPDLASPPCLVVFEAGSQWWPLRRDANISSRDISCSVRRSLSSLDLAHLGPSSPHPFRAASPLIAVIAGPEPLSGARPWSPSSTLGVRSHTYHPLSMYVVVFFVL